MVTHPLLESRFYAACELIGGLDFMRARPARDPRHRRGVRCRPDRPDRALPRPAAVRRGDPVVSLQEGSTPLVHAPRVSEQAGREVWLKLEGANPTGSFKDRGMTCAVSDAVRSGREAVDLRLDRQHGRVAGRVRARARASAAR
jgi:hypothetical protein